MNYTPDYNNKEYQSLQQPYSIPIKTKTNFGINQNTSRQTSMTSSGVVSDFFTVINFYFNKKYLMLVFSLKCLHNINTMKLVCIFRQVQQVVKEVILVKQLIYKQLALPPHIRH